ncbi:hypothetical protein C900_02985 [Fulvivirga imtechensis AK7]|uniref:Uncharacterized protein n=1 Tax=Fulvivirga imtechensis AK7 TaxID=1237149 RepID=L8JQE9_9BACT|nr:hypothetical protein [Fulvivirga imtechensis]ELR71181.1 hypothetical protein C900_02985 [Fulvivirga imtechensis AK7]
MKVQRGIQNKTTTPSAQVNQKENNSKRHQVVENSAELTIQRKYQRIADQSSHVKHLGVFQEMVNDSSLQLMRSNGINNVIQRLKHTKAEVNDALDSGVIKSFLAGIYGLRYRHHNDEWIYMTASAHQEDGYEASGAKYWYRAMPEAEFLAFTGSFQFNGDSYGGIAPNRAYVQNPKYFGNNKPATHIVEFSTPGEGFLYDLFKERLGVHGNPKAEGGGTFGLGPSGNGAGQAGVIFNQLLRDAAINYKVVDWKDVNTLP